MLYSSCRLLVPLKREFCFSVCARVLVASSSTMAFRFGVCAFIAACTTSTTDVPVINRYSITMEIEKSESTNIPTNQVLDVIHSSIEYDAIISVIADEDNIFTVDITVSSDKFEDKELLMTQVDAKLTGKMCMLFEGFLRSIYVVHEGTQQLNQCY